MNVDSQVSLRWPVVFALAILLLAIGASATYVVLKSSGRSSVGGEERPGIPAPRADNREHPAISSDSAASSGVALPDVLVTLSQEAVERAGITVTPVTVGAGTAGVRLPAVVEPNAYRQVTVMSLVAGRVTRVLVELGEHVRQGETMAQIFSPELAEAQTRYISARADLEAHERELERTVKLAQIGAASRQELERIHAEHTSRKSGVESARSRLELLGLSPSRLESLAVGKDVAANSNVPAPTAGVVTERLANVGLNVDTAAKLFTVVDLSTVWVVADLYEKDFSRVRVGSKATITTTAYPGLVLRGRVSYIDPQVSPQTRTAKARVEVPNPRNELRLGMYADVVVETPDGAAVTLIPRSAVQNVGDRHVVYIVNPKEPGKFIEREVRLGQPAGEHVQALAGVGAGDVLVTAGSFFVRAERERLGLRQQPAEPAAPPTHAQSGSNATGQKSEAQTVRVTVTDQGFDPSRLTLRAGRPVRVTFLRTSDKTCATEVAFPSLNIKRALPLNQPVEIEFTPAKGDLAFVCGMNMLRGTIVAQ